MRFIPVLVFLAVLIVFSIPLTVSDVSAYTQSFIFQNDSDTNRIVNSPSFYWQGSCDVNISLFVTTNSAGYLLDYWYSPNQTAIKYSLPVYGSAVTCKNQGVGTTSASRNNFYESRTTTLPSGTNAKSWINTTYSCLPINEWLTYSNTAANDAYSQYPYGYYYPTGGYCDVGAPGTIPSATSQLNQIITNLQNSFYTPCGTDLLSAKYGSGIVSCAFNRFYGYTWWTTTPFNSMAAGYVNISVTNQLSYYNANCGTPTCSVNKIYLWDKTANTTTALSAAVPYSGNLNLLPEREYWLLIGSQCVGTSGAGGTCLSYYNFSDYNISIFSYIPDWSCSDWSDCAEGVETRSCTDLNHRVIDKTETQWCSIVVLENATLGFENVTADFFTGKKCGYDYNLIQCLGQTVIHNITRIIPSDWNMSGESLIGYGFDYLTMTPEWYKEGERSLKLWYLPPALGEPISNTTCGNSSIGSIPVMQKDDFRTVIVSKNVTFPASNMALSIWSKMCHEVVEKNGQKTAYDYFFWNVTCPATYYGINDPLKIKGDFRLWIFDNDKGKIIFDYFGIAKWTESNVYIDLSHSGVVALGNYTILLTLNPGSLTTQNPHCVYFDDLRYNVIEHPLADSCFAGCDGFNYTELITDSKGNTLCITTPYSLNCMSSENYGKCERYCLNDAYYTEAIPTKDCYTENPDYVYAANSPNCITQATTNPESSALTADYSFIWSKLFISICVIIAVIGLIGYYTKTWELPAIIAILLILAFASFDWIPLWIAVVVVLGIIVMFAYILSKVG